MQSQIRTILIWALVLIAVCVPIAAAAFSPLLAWRNTIYILAGFAGIIGLAIMFFQPLLAGGYLPGVSAARARRLHSWIGLVLVLLVVLHVAGLWITSPPDVIDALLFASPTPFSVWGVIAMWALFAAATLAGFRRRLRLRMSIWRVGHTALATTIIVCSVLHTILIEGTMETVSKTILCLLLLAVTAKVIIDRRVWANLSARD